MALSDFASENEEGDGSFLLSSLPIGVYALRSFLDTQAPIQARTRLLRPYVSSPV